MIWKKKESGWALPIDCWSTNLEEGALKQAINMSNMPCAFHHVALMPDAHQGMGVCIGGVLALKNAICPNAIGVDIGCGMCALKTDMDADVLEDMSLRRKWQQEVKMHIPVGEGNSHDKPQEWDGFDHCSFGCEGWPIDIDRRNLHTLGGGNHFIEMQKDDFGKIWLMIHSGSRNLGHRIATHYHEIAKKLCHRFFVNLPDDDLAFLPDDDPKGQEYIKDMNFALDYARENRSGMMKIAYECLKLLCGNLGVHCSCVWEYDIHHNYAALENHFGENVWVHRKGATSAKAGQDGIIPGSMGTHSYIVQGLGNEDSFMSCSHGAGRRMSRTAASQTLTVDECDKAMEGIVCDRWSKVRHGKSKGMYDLSEAPGAYKDIEEVIKNESDLVTVKTRLTPIAVLKG